MGNPIQDAAALGHSIWYDNLQRSMFSAPNSPGKLAKLISEGLRGMTSNPTIFEKAIGHSHDYDDAIAKLDPALDDIAAFEQLAIDDIQHACDLFRPLYDSTGGGDGFVSLEVSPRLAHDTAGTAADAKRLYAAVARPNVMIKIPGTPEGMPAIAQTIGAGINVNVTLLFSLDAYIACAHAYMSGLETLRTQGKDLSKVASVASFFLSRIDTAIDLQLGQAHDHRDLLGQAAIANAKVAYEQYGKLLAHDRWKSLAADGARPQRLLWASTSAKNPAYDKLHYANQLIGADTVDTVPAETFDAFLAHGHVAHTLARDVAGAHHTLDRIGRIGISMHAVTDKLLADGVASFSKSFDELLAAVATKRKKLTAR